MLEPGQAVVNVVSLADTVKEQLECIAITLSIGKLDVIVRQDSVDFVGNIRNQVTKKLRCC